MSPACFDKYTGLACAGNEFHWSVLFSDEQPLTATYNLQGAASYYTYPSQAWRLLQFLCSNSKWANPKQTIALVYFIVWQTNLVILWVISVLTIYEYFPGFPYCVHCKKQALDLSIFFYLFQHGNCYRKYMAEGTWNLSSPSVVIANLFWQPAKWARSRKSEIVVCYRKEDPLGMQFLSCPSEKDCNCKIGIIFHGKAL